jgi:hypothetical protein
MATDPNPVVMPVAPAPVSRNPDHTTVGRTARSLDDLRRPNLDVSVFLRIGGADGQQSRREDGQYDWEPEDLRSL